MRLLAISDLHLGHAQNRDALRHLDDHAHADDWLVLAGDVGERPEHLRLALDHLAPRFGRVLWVPGNHDLWCPPDALDRTRGEARYRELVDICRGYGALTPEDEYPRWPEGGGNTPPLFLAPLFLLYDYSFRPPDIPREEAIRWARASGVACGDEQFLSPDPWPSRDAWCDARCALTEARLDALSADSQTVLINHWPLRYDLARPPLIPRFSIWCGTTRTEDWPRRFRARAVVSGHLHLRTTLFRHGVRFEEVSLGYPRDWRHERGLEWYLREILPGTSADANRFLPARDPFHSIRAM